MGTELKVEVNDDGSIGTLPPELQKFLDKRIKQSYADAHDKALATLRDERTARPDPVEIEKAKALEMEVSKLKEAEALREKNYQEAQRIREERHAAELAEKAAALDATAKEVARRTARIQELAQREIRAAAVAAGARKESLDELELLLGGQLGLDDALQVFVKDTQDAGKARLDKDGKPVSIEGFVTQYLTDHPHHKAAPSGRGGGATGGRSLSGQTGAATEKSSALAELERNPTIRAVGDALKTIGRTA